MKAFFLWLSPYIELTKPRICFMALLMVALGFVWSNLALHPGFLDLPLFAWTIIGTGLIGASCGILNQYLERDLDKKMTRTSGRPIPTGKVSPKTALQLGWVLALVGEFILLVMVNSVVAVFGALSFFLYLGVYTPGKLVSPMAALVGAIPGALPPLMGSIAGYGAITINGAFLFAILFLWQMPHFFSLAWVYRKDFAKADFKILSVVDKSGKQSVRQSLYYALALVAVTLLPSVLGMTGKVYFYGALITGALFVFSIILWFWYGSDAQARKVFQASLLYLPLLGGLLLLDSI